MNNDQPIPLTEIIKELRGVIATVTTTQETFSTNSTAYNEAVNTGLQSMQLTINEINGLIDQITVLITGLKSQIAVFEAKQLADPTPRLTAEIEQLRTQLSDAQATQADAATAMRDSITALNANNAAMSASATAQDVVALNTTITATTTSLNDIKTKLENLLQNAPVIPPPAQNNLLTNDTMIQLSNGQQISYADLKNAVNQKASELQQISGSVPAKYANLQNAVNDPNATLDSIQTAIGRSQVKVLDGVLQGGKRRRRTKKQRKTKRRKTKRNQKGGYRYTKRNQDSDSGRGRGLNTKRKRTC